MNLSRCLLAACCLVPVVGCSATVTTQGGGVGGSDGSDGTSPVADGGTAGLGSDGSASGDSDAGAKHSGDAAAPLKFGPLTSVSPECNVTERYSEYGSAGFENGFYAVKIAPASYPFQVESLSYTLKSGMVINPKNNDEVVNCMASTPHNVGFFKVPSGAPTASPANVQIWKASGFNTDRTEMLPVPVVIEQGEVGYAIIQMVRNVSATCVRACSTGATARGNFRTDATSAPFAWSAFDPSGNMMISLNGRPVLR